MKNAVKAPNYKPTGKPKEDIVGPKEARELIEKPKSGGGWD